MSVMQSFLHGARDKLSPGSLVGGFNQNVVSIVPDPVENNRSRHGESLRATSKFQLASYKVAPKPVPDDPGSKRVAAEYSVRSTQMVTEEKSGSS